MSAPTDVDVELLRAAIEVSRRAPRIPLRYAVGALVADADGRALASGYTGQNDPAVHAEEAALAALDGRPGLSATTIYTSLEPCTSRRSGPVPCTGLILAAGIRRVVFAMREPALFAACEGVARLEAAGVDVIEVPDLAAEVREVNLHLLGALG